MENLLHNLSEVFAVSIIHSLWQCMVIFLLVKILLSSAIDFSAAARYKIGLAAIVCATGWFIYTLFDQAQYYSWQSVKFTAGVTSRHLPFITSLKKMANASERYEITLERYLPYITIAYTIGMLFHALKLLTGWLQLKQIRQYLQADNSLQHTVSMLSQKLNMAKQVAIGLTNSIDVPCIAGYLKPVIMLPLAISNYLSATEIEAILLHELAHIKRNDYLINLLQQLMSALLFFNPFVYLINKIINHERENTCDDMVVDITNQPLTYAQALLKIQQYNQTQLPLALAATGTKYHLLTRIERIMKTKKPMANMRHLAIALTLLIASSVSVAWLNPAIASGKLSVKKLKPVIAAIFNPSADTLKIAKPAVKNRTASKTRKTNGKNDIIYHNNGIEDPKLEAMGKQMEAYGKQIEDYYNSSAYKKMQEGMDKTGKQMTDYYEAPAFKKMQQDMEKAAKQIEAYYNSAANKNNNARMEELGKQMDAYYNNPALKNLTAKQERLGKELETAYGDGSEITKLGKQMEAAGKKMSEYYDSPEFKKKSAELRKKYHVPSVYSYDENSQDPNVKAYLNELKMIRPQSVTDAQEQMKKLGNEMRAHTSNPAVKLKQQQMRALGDSMRIAYNNPQIKQLQLEMKELGNKIRVNGNNPQIKQLQESLRKQGEQMREYGNNMQTKEMQQKMKQFGEQMRNYGNNPEMKEVQQKMKILGEQMKAYTTTPEFKKKVEDWKKEHPDGYDASN